MSEYAQVRAHFESDVQDHQMSVRRDDGPFRHVEFVGQRGLSRVVLISWPYNLLVAGSHGSFHFERHGRDTEDMFDWLRGLRVDPDRWASKLVNGARSVEEYDPARLKAAIEERVAEAVQDGWAPAGLEAAVKEQILDSHWMSEEQNALRLVSEFQLGMRYRSECSCGESAEHDSHSSAVCWNALTHHGSGPAHKVKVRQTGGFTFDDFTDWNVHRLDYHYVYQCHAAVWAIGQYDAAKAAEPVFFQSGHVYEREHHGRRVEFRVTAIDSSPDGEQRLARGWRTDAHSDWESTDSDDFEGWTEVPAAGAVLA
ncbi:hypothetical protein ACIGMX_34840 [Streptomyces aquilus]|uniref:hypothetical protein n=1 Tax=Streptomyces aquilus TaxID=2548456 RepID=UPI0037D4E72B